MIEAPVRVVPVVTAPAATIDAVPGISVEADALAPATSRAC